MSALISPCRHCSAKHKLPFLKRDRQKSSLNAHGKKLSPRNSNNIQFWLLTASTWGFFLAFNYWNFPPAMFLSGKYLFGNAAFQINAMIIHTVGFVVVIQEVSPFYNFMHTPGKTLRWAFNSTGVRVAWGRVGKGKAHQQELAQWVVPEKAPLRTRCGVGKHS